MTYQQYPEQPHQYPPANLPTPMPPQWSPPASYGASAPYGVIPVVPIAPKSTGAAVVLELVPGFFGIFGIGNIYAKAVVPGIVLMVSFWVLFWINIALMSILIGLVTLPLTWIAYLVVGPIMANRAVDRHNRGMLV